MKKNFTHRKAVVEEYYPYGQTTTQQSVSHSSSRDEWQSSRPSYFQAFFNSPWFLSECKTTA